MRASAFFPLCWLLLAACSKQPPGVPTPATAPGPPVGRATPLSSGLAYVEQYGSKADTMSPTGHLEVVDYASRLVITPARELLGQLAGNERSVLPPSGDFEQMRMDSIGWLVSEAEAYVASALEVVQAVQAAGPVEQLSVGRVDTLQQQIRAQAAVGLTLVGLVRATADTEARALIGDDQDAVDALVIEMTDPILTDNAGNEVILNPSAFAEFLSRQINFATARAARNAEIANRAGTIQFRMRAWLRRSGSEPAAVSILNYDDIESFDGPKRSRIAFRLTEDEQRRVEHGFAVAQDAARLVRDVRDRRSTLRQGLRELETQIRTAVSGLKDLVLDGDLIATIQQAVDQAKTAAQGEAQRALQDFEAFLVNLRVNVDTIASGRDSLTAAQASTQGLVAALTAMQRGLNSALRLAAGYRRSARAVPNWLATLGEVLEGAAVAEASAVKGQVDSIREEFLGFAQNLEQHGVLAEIVLGFASRSQVIAMADGFDASNVDTRVRALELDAVVPGTIFLNSTPADRGDELEIRAELFAINELGVEERIQEARRTFRIDRLGLTSDVSSHLVFIKRFGDGASPDEDTTFEPAPSASWTLHHRIRSRNAWSVLNPGIGISTAAISFDDAAIQIGLGVHVTLFSDLVTYGIGHNMNAERDPWYQYLGVEVLQALDGVGSLVRGFGGTER